MMKALICGGRNVGRTDPSTGSLQAGPELKKASAERKFVSDKMQELHQGNQFRRIVAGNEGGAERLGAQWAVANSVPVEIVKRKNSRESVTQRNRRILDDAAPELVVAFGAGESTKALLAEAKRRGIAVMEIDLPKE